MLARTGGFNQPNQSLGFGQSPEQASMRNGGYASKRMTGFMSPAIGEALGGVLVNGVPIEHGPSDPYPLSLELLYTLGIDSRLRPLLTLDSDDRVTAISQQNGVTEPVRYGGSNIPRSVTRFNRPTNRNHQVGVEVRTGDDGQNVSVPIMQRAHPRGPDNGLKPKAKK